MHSDTSGTNAWIVARSSCSSARVLTSAWLKYSSIVVGLFGRAFGSRFDPAEVLPPDRRAPLATRVFGVGEAFDVASLAVFGVGFFGAFVTGVLARGVVGAFKAAAVCPDGRFLRGLVLALDAVFGFGERVVVAVARVEGFRAVPMGQLYLVCGPHGSFKMQSGL